MRSAVTVRLVWRATSAVAGCTTWTIGQSHLGDDAAGPYAAGCCHGNHRDPRPCQAIRFCRSRRRPELRHRARIGDWIPRANGAGKTRPFASSSDWNLLQQALPASTACPTTSCPSRSARWVRRLVERLLSGSDCQEPPADPGADRRRRAVPGRPRAGRRPPVRRREPANRCVLTRHAPAAEPGRGADRRPGGPDPRRACQWPGPRGRALAA
jgi:hypothetical protein